MMRRLLAPWRSSMRLGIVCLVLGSLLAGCPQPSGKQASLETDDQKVVYALGAANARNLRSLELSPEEVDLMIAGLRDALVGKEQLKPEEYMDKLQGFVQARMQRAQEAERAAATAFMDQAGKTAGAVVKPSGLVYVEKKKGDGTAPAASDRVKVHYRGTLRDGTQFDSSYDRDEPAVFPLDGVIPCWTEALQLMQVGGSAEIYCPAAIAYGDNGQPPLIRPGAALRFEVELLSIE
jgi:FKBP-type peptidyl-prolyl cis-trans isomerase FkpA